MAITDEQIKRINELYHKSKSEGLTEEELQEQKELRAAYIKSIRENMRGSLKNISLLNPDGTITDLSKKDDTIPEEKSRLRVNFRELRDQITTEQKDIFDEQVRERLFASEEYQQADAVFTYLSFSSEVDTRQIIKRCFQDGKTVCVPKIRNHSMVFIPITPDSEFQTNSYGIEEPKTNSICSTFLFSRVLFLVPGVVFDQKLHRIGYGGGYYDKYFSEETACNHVSVALAYELQITNQTLPHQPHDYKPNVLLTQTRRIDDKK